MLKRCLSLHIFIVLLSVVSSLSYAEGGSKGSTNTHLTSYLNDYSLIGEGRLNFMFFSVYDARLYGQKAENNVKPPFALSLEYLRDLDGKAIAERSVEEMRGLGADDEIKLEKWQLSMEEIFPDVDENTTLTGIYSAEGEAIFLNNGAEIGRIEDSEFTKYFFDIWLNENTSEPELRAQLLGLE